MSGNISNQTNDGTGAERIGIGADHRYDAEAAEPPSVAVARAFAEVLGESPCSSTPQLYEYVDPDALDSLFVEWGSPDAPTTVEMEVDGHTVVVRGEGTVIVRDSGV